LSTIRSLVVSSLVLFAAAPALALDSLEEVACICADDAINTGDYVSCVSHLSRRLVKKGAITNGERSDAISAASSVDYEQLALDCEADSNGAACAPAGWGVSLETDSPFYRANDFNGAAAIASGLLRQWNFTDRDAFQANPNGGDPPCQYEVVIRDQRRNVVRRDFVFCGPTFTVFDLPAGTCEELSFELPLEALNAETGLLDNETLPPGIYRIEATWTRHGPQVAPVLVAEGGFPGASVAVRVLP
jgi:hypothetical protein